MLRRLKRETLRGRIVQEIKRAIIEGNLKPGDRLPTEMELAESLGVSRSSVREATKALEFIGVLSSSPKNGCVVGNFDMHSVVDQLRFHLEARGATLEELLDARQLLEVGVLPLTARHGTDSDFDELQASIDEMQKAIKAGDTGIESDVVFHSGIFKAAQNRVLQSFSDLIKEFFAQFQREVMEQGKNGLLSIKEHQQICDALRKRDAVMAQEVMTRHLESARKLITEAESAKTDFPSAIE